MRFRTLFSIILLGLLAVSAPFLRNSPVRVNAASGILAAFTYNPCVMCAAPGEIVFFNANWSISPNGPIASYTWDFGDGSALFKTTSASANHDYLSASGTWQVTLTVQDTAGQVDAVTQTVMFFVHPDFAFQPQSPGVGQMVVFNASGSQNFSSGSILGFAWSFGDGTTGSGKLASHAYAAAGLYRVSMVVQTSQGNAAVSKTIVVGQSPPPPPPPPPSNIIVRSVFGIAFYNNSGEIIIEPASLFLNMTVKDTNSTGTLFSLNSGQITIGPSKTLAVQRNFTATSGQAFQSNTGRLTVTAVMIEIFSCQQYQPPCMIPSPVYQLYLTGPSRLVSANNSFVFFTRLFGFLYNSQVRIGLFFVVGFAPGDVDEDGKVDIGDMAIVASCFGANTVQSSMNAPSSSSTGYSRAFYADVNGDGRVDIQDLALVASSFGQTY